MLKIQVKLEMSSVINLDTTAALNVKINRDRNNIPSITNLATNTVLTSVEKNPNVKNFKKKLPITQKLVKLKIELPLIMLDNYYSRI